MPAPKFDKSLPFVFVIGHHKTATRSIHDLFRNDGYKSLHWQRHTLANKIKSNFWMFNPLMEGVEKANVYSDLESLTPSSTGRKHEFFYAYRLFPLLDIQHPGSFFVYNYRNVDDWINSRLQHADARYSQLWLEAMRSASGSSSATISDLVAQWKKSFYQHQKDVLSYFNGKNNLLQVDIDSIPSQKSLISSLRTIGFNLTAETLPRRGVTIAA